jgi:hypothetical protein
LTVLLLVTPNEYLFKTQDPLAPPEARSHTFGNNPVG